MNSDLRNGVDSQETHYGRSVQHGVGLVSVNSWNRMLRIRSSMNAMHDEHGAIASKDLIFCSGNMKKSAGCVEMFYTAL